MPKKREHDTRRSKKLQHARGTPTAIKDEPASPQPAPSPALMEEMAAVKYEEAVIEKYEEPAVVKDEIEEDVQYKEPPMKCESELIIKSEMEMHIMSDDAECAEVEVGDEGEETAQVSDNSKSCELKIKQEPSPTKAAIVATPPSGNKKRKVRRGSGTSSDEERWLTAIEAGKLEEVDDEMKKIKNPKLMTARQRAMYERHLDKEPSPGAELLMSLPTGYREKEKPQTAEQIRKAELKSQRRKQQADEKREKDKKKTMDRLLKKQDTKQRSAARSKSNKVLGPMISYRNTLEGATITMPPEHNFPLQARKAKAPPKVQLCCIPGCGKPKVYSCSKTHVPLCSLGCYRKNVESINLIIC